MKNFYKNHIALICLLLLAASGLFSGCKLENAEKQTPNDAPETRELTDDLGRRVKIPAKIERAVSLAPNLTEIIFAVDAGGALVGDTSYCDYPAAAQKIQKVGDTLNPNLETIIALKPQIVLVSTASQIESFTGILEQRNIAVFVTNPKNLDGVYNSVSQIGEIFGRAENARQVVAEMKRRVAAVEAKTSGAKSVKTFVQISKEPLFTIGEESFLTELVARAGGVSATADVGGAYPKFSKETAAALQPEAIILSDSPDNLEPNEVFKNSPAVKNGKIFKISADLLSRPAPRIVDALEQIAQSLHPESFH